MSKRVRKGKSRIASKVVNNYSKQLEANAQATVGAAVSNYSRPPPPPPRSYYPPPPPPRSYYPPPPSYRGAAAEIPPPKKPLLGPLEKKILIYGLLFIAIAIVIIIIIRTVSSKIDGYYHSSTGYHCKKNNGCGKGKKHNCDGGCGATNKGHNFS